MKKSKLKRRNKEKKKKHTQHRTEPLNMNVGEFQLIARKFEVKLSSLDLYNNNQLITEMK